MRKAFGHLATKSNAILMMILLCLGLLAPVAMGQTQPIALPNTVEQCMACHDPMGKPEDTNFPIIGGQYAEYLANALRAYQNGL
ncbi:MAG: hypothetical protein ING02_16760 [Roseomonas sp.]|nr:hypothetical protein [Roseomonas sp.]